LSFGVGEGVLVALVIGEFEVLGGVLEGLVESFDEGDLLFDTRASSQDFLGFFGVVPEAGGGGLFVEFG